MANSSKRKLICQHKKEKCLESYNEKINLLKKEISSEPIIDKTGFSPAGRAGQVVFISICNGKRRALVYKGAGKTINDAWKKASYNARLGIERKRLNPLWVKVDIVRKSQTLDTDEIKNKIKNSRSGFFRYGISLDTNFENAFLEEELNAVKVYNKEKGFINEKALNHYRDLTKRKRFDKIPDRCIIFSCLGWICDEEGNVHKLESGKLSYGHRKINALDDKFIKDIIVNSSEYLMNQIKEDGSFVYGYYPCFNKEIKGYNILRHSGSIWALLCRYNIMPDEDLVDKINKTIAYMMESVVYQDEDKAYILEKKSEEIKLGGNGIAIILLTEYMNIFKTDIYRELCCKLGNGILNMLNQETGKYYHIFNVDFTKKNEYRTVYYDGEATFALTRLYGMTKDKKWLDAACSAVNNFIKNDYTKYRDHWVAYSMNEITKYVTDNEDYYNFALQNAQKNLETIYNRDTTYHTYLELLMATFNTYQRMTEKGIKVKNFDLRKFLKTIYIRVNRQIEGYFFPEYAMYMRRPNTILNSFMVRFDQYRVRIDDIQHNIGGLYQYYINYNKLIELGMKTELNKK